MCGFAGLFTNRGAGSGELRAVAEQMAAPLRHRGPDDRGAWADEEVGVAFGFRRLSIIDLSREGHQPMVSASGRYVLVFNGEIYNHRSLRERLAGSGHGFRGHGDTEVLLAAVEEWGVPRAVSKFVGMFAFAVWDRRERELHLVRDRLGIKPLFVHEVAGQVAFASELKALFSLPGFDAAIDPDALAAYLRYLYVPAPGCIYRNASKLLPGHILTVRDPERPLPAPVPYWSLEDVARRGLNDPFEGTEQEAIGETERLLFDAVGLRMHADVPLGAFLSGGIDSSLVVALMQAQAERPARTYTVAFEEEEWNEADHAARVAAHLGTDHTEMTLTASEALDVVPDLPTMFDEPFASPSAIPNYLICRVARGEVTVALSGTGGDEIFAGYNRYTVGERLIEPALRVPAFLRRPVARGVLRLSPRRWQEVYDRSTSLVPGADRLQHPARKLHKLAQLMVHDSKMAMYRSLVSAWQRPGDVLIAGGENGGRLERILGTEIPNGGLLEQCLLADQLTYLADDQLAKMDRVSMAVSLEVRVPLLDHRLVEWSWRLPSHLKRRNGQGKWILRQMLYRHVPRLLIDRPKMGLSVPIERWLRDPLRDWAEDLLSEARLERESYLRTDTVRGAWTQFQRGDGPLDLSLWAILMFQAWMDRWPTSDLSAASAPK